MKSWIFLDLIQSPYRTKCIIAEGTIARSALSAKRYRRSHYRERSEYYRTKCIIAEGTIMRSALSEF